MHWFSKRSRQLGTSLTLAWQALKSWRIRQWVAAAIAALVVALVIGYATVLIPNSAFTRDIEPTWWDHPVWLITSGLTGILIATYVRPQGKTSTAVHSEVDSPLAQHEQRRQERGTKMGMAGGFLAWFAVGCPVCNKIALLVLGYSGALTWFAPMQPVLAISAMLLSGLAVVWRLKGQIVCTLPKPPRSTAKPLQDSTIK